MWSLPSMPAGSVLLFTESLTHGTAPWQAQHERRTLLYKYLRFAYRLDIAAGGSAEIGGVDAAPANPAARAGRPSAAFSIAL